MTHDPTHQRVGGDEPEGDGSGTWLAAGVRVREGAMNFAAARSSGPGGQNVNKVSTKIELRIALSEIPLDPAAMARLVRLAGRRITAEGELVISSDESRSQSQNRSAAIERLKDLVKRALIVPKPRFATKPTKGSQRRRVEAKKGRSEVKKGRRRVDGMD